MRKKGKQAETAAPNPEAKRVTPVDIQQKEFRLAMRGYNERDVDQFLDEVTEEVARLYADNKRLREEVEFGKTTRLETTGAAEAEGIVRQAREEAARIIAQATARASTIGPTDPGDRPGGESGPAPGAPPQEIMSIFLARERAFLQNMANLIQAHAEGVKGDVRRVREQVVRHVPGASSPATRPPDVDSVTGAEADIEGRVEAERQEAKHHASPQMGPDEPTQAWEPRSDPERPATSTRHDIVDLTEEGEHAAKHAITSPRVEDDDAREDRSIRELFWGED